MGNLQSISNAFELLDENITVVDDPGEISEPRGLVLPGVGAFGEAIENLREKEFVTPLEELVLENDIPFLGICLGMQFLATESEEGGHHKGLDWIPGTVNRIEPDEEGFEVPHMGWNETEVVSSSPLYTDLGDDPTLYYAHSFKFDVSNPEQYVSSRAYHGTWFTTGVTYENIHGVQFHPEKSQGTGLRMIENFIDITEKGDTDG